ncbi:MAG: hypothetical protein D6796_16245 [Caldilineae bacterium]|nr:MAG: hypothetical protein D6796_16245 [Caldilineae bacterium]
MNPSQAKIRAFFQTLIRLWRFANSAILLVAFFAPWVSGCSGPLFASPTPSPANSWSGAEVLFWGTVALFVSFFRGFLFFGPVIAGLYAVLFYIFLNTRHALSPRPEDKYWLWLWPAIGLCGFVYPEFFIGFTSDALWGYWLAGAGLASSIVLEIIYWNALPPPNPKP